MDVDRIRNLADMKYDIMSVEGLRLEKLCGITLLHTSILCGNSMILQCLLELGISPNVRWNGFSPLHRAVEVGNVAAVKILGKFGANLRERVTKGFNLLELAVSLRNANVLRALISVGLKPNYFPQNSLSLLFTATAVNDVDIAEVLIDYGDVFDENEFLYHEAIDRNCANAIRIFKNLGLNINGVDHNMETPIFKAAKDGKADLIKVLMDHGANLFLRDIDYYTMLHRAAQIGDHRAAKVLISVGINVDITGGPWARTPLHLAIAHRRTKVVEVLLDCGADVNIKSIDGDSAMDFAEECNSCDIYDLLRKVS